MVSKSSSHPDIFYKDKENKFQGPFSKGQMQNMYDDYKLKSSFPVYFMKEGDRPNDSMLFNTIDDLRDLNGERATFKCPSDDIPADKTQSNAEQTESLSEENLDQYCCAARRAERKRREKEAAEQAAKELKRLEIEEDANVFIDILEHFRNGENEEETKFDVDFTETEPRINQLNESEQLMLNSEIRKRINSKPFFFCSFCKRFMFTSRHVFMHIACPEHKQEVDSKPPILKQANELLLAMIGEKTPTKTKKLEGKKLKISELPPTQEFLDKLHKDVWENPEGLDDSKCAPALVDAIAASSKRAQFIQKLQGAIGQDKARCIQCDLIFADYKNYCMHLTTFTHLHKKTFDAVTIIYNLEQGARAKDSI